MKEQRFFIFLVKKANLFDIFIGILASKSDF